MPKSALTKIHKQAQRRVQKRRHKATQHQEIAPAPPQEQSPPVDYEVEQLLDKKIENGVVTYFIKWKGYGIEFNTWEPTANLGCPALVRKYENNAKKSRGSALQPATSDASEVPSTSKPKETKRKPKKGCYNSSLEHWREAIQENDLKLEHIVGVTKEDDGTIFFLVKWCGVDEEDLILNCVMNHLFTEEVILYYRKQMKWWGEGDWYSISSGDILYNTIQ